MDTLTKQNPPTRSTPFIVGVTGHRDLNPGELLHLRGAVTAFLHQLKEKLPDTQIRIAVGMAEGADLLVAQTALDLGVRVNAVLPMPLEHYADDFDAETVALLNALLNHPEVDCDELMASSASAMAGGANIPMQRDAMYANLTETLIRRSSLLLALWDGHSSALPGGTADTVLRYLGLRTESNQDDSHVVFVDGVADLDTAARLVYWIPAGRSGGETSAELRGPCYLSGVGDNSLLRQAHMPSQLAHQLAELNEYNRESQRYESHGHRPLDSLMSVLSPDVLLQHRPTLRAIDLQYGRSDALAVYYQKRSDRLFKYFSVATFGMATAYLTYEKLSDTQGLLYLYLFILLSGFGLYSVLHGRRWFAKHLMYRVLAETMRAKFFLRLSGADHLVDAQEVLSLSGIDRFHGFGWISYVLKGVEPPEVGLARVPTAQESTCVESAWIQNQQKYFVRKVASLEQSSRRVERSKISLLVVILFVVLTLVAFSEQLHHIELWHGITLKNVLTFFMGLVALMFGAWQLHQNKMATRELLWQYRNQLTHFSRASAQLARAKAWNRRREIIAALGRDSLMESYLWTIHRYHREHEPPAAT